jgi:hypothetical protein
MIRFSKAESLGVFFTPAVLTLSLISDISDIRELRLKVKKEY